MNAHRNMRVLDALPDGELLELSSDSSLEDQDDCDNEGESGSGGGKTQNKNQNKVDFVHIPSRVEVAERLRILLRERGELVRALAPSALLGNSAASSSSSSSA